MRAVVQRVSSAAVTVDARTVGEIGHGLMVLIGVEKEDGPADADYIAGKIGDLRVFEDEAHHMNRSVQDVGGAVLVVSQFTLFADTRRGRRPGFTGAAPPELARRCYERFAAAIGDLGVTVATGRFGAEMAVSLVNDGPFTLWLDTADREG